MPATKTGPVRLPDDGDEEDDDKLRAGVPRNKARAVEHLEAAIAVIRGEGR